MLSEINQTKTNTVWYHFYVESKKKKQMNKYNNRNRVADTDNRLSERRGEGGRREIVEGDEEI